MKYQNTKPSDTKGVVDIEKLSFKAMSIAAAYDDLSEYGKALINCVIQWDNAQNHQPIRRIICGGEEKPIKYNSE